MKKKLNKKGFTLMEMLIVVAIIAVLLGITIPSFSDAKGAAENAKNQANVRITSTTNIVNQLVSDTNF